MKTHQLNARIDATAYAVLTEMTKKLHTTKAHLTEKAIFLLKEHFDQIQNDHGDKRGADIFLTHLSQSMTQYDELYKKLAK